MSRALPILLLLAATAVPASAQTRIDWYTVDGGGGESAAGRYTVRGTAAQPDADEVSLCSSDGGNCAQARFEVTGGFWTGGTPGAPGDGDIFQDGFES